MPGITDIHTHTLMGGQAEMFDFNFASSPRVDDICAAVRAWAEKLPPGGWIVGAQFGTDKLPTLNSATSLAKLDAASLGRPVLLRDDSHHNRWVNSETLRRYGITNDRLDPDRGEFGRDPQSGELTVMPIEAASGMAASMKSIMAALKGLDDHDVLTAWAGRARPAVEPSFMFGSSGDELLAVREQFRSLHVSRTSSNSSLTACPASRPRRFMNPTQPIPSAAAAFAARR